MALTSHFFKWENSLFSRLSLAAFNLFFKIVINWVVLSLGIFLMYFKAGFLTTFNGI